MLEGDELFENASETAYRICSSPPPEHPKFVPWNRLFSAHWDPTDDNRIVLCSQNGQIRVVDRRTDEVQTFNVQFRRFISNIADSNAEGKILTYHFDKMCLIPNRPGEFVFLLGVSRSVLYSSVPGYSKSDVGAVGRVGSHVFHHGCPVFELYSHGVRITSLAASSTGNFLATGDETGLVKITNIFLFRADLPTDHSRGELGKPRKQSQQPAFNEGLTVTLEAHEGTVYSVHFLPHLYGKKKHRELFLATGSNDRVVKIWKIESHKERIFVTPYLLLSTMSSDILCINSWHIRGELAAGEFVVDESPHSYLFRSDAYILSIL